MLRRNWQGGTHVSFILPLLEYKPAQATDTETPTPCFDNLSKAKAVSIADQKVIGNGVDRIAGLALAMDALKKLPCPVSTST